MDCARRTQDAPPRPVCGPWTGAHDGLWSHRTDGRRPAAIRQLIPSIADTTPFQQSATLAHDSHSHGDAAAVLQGAGRTDARREACAVRLPVLVPTRWPLAAQRPSGPFPPWYSLHTGTETQNQPETSGLQIGHFRAKIYPSGVMLEGVSLPAIPQTGDVQRGAIEGFSHAAARRLRETFFTLHVPDFSFWSFTLTTHQVFSPVEWRQTMMRFRQAVKRSGWAGVWRVELQKRKAPHAHVAMWLPAGVTFEPVRDLWLRATGERNDADAFKWAVVGKAIPHDAHGWAVYMGLHNGKHKEAQLGWLGKQWGVWNREILQERDPATFTLTPREHSLFLRILRKWDVAQKIRREWERDRALLAQILEANQGCASSFCIVIKRPVRRLLHRGNLLRCVEGSLVESILGAIQLGRISSVKTS